MRTRWSLAAAKTNERFACRWASSGSEWLSSCTITVGWSAAFFANSAVFLCFFAFQAALFIGAASTSFGCTNFRCLNARRVSLCSLSLSQTLLTALFRSLALDGTLLASHHPFTAPLPEDKELLRNHPESVSIAGGPFSVVTARSKLSVLFCRRAATRSTSCATAGKLREGPFESTTLRCNATFLPMCSK